MRARLHSLAPLGPVHTRAIVGYTNTHPNQTHRVCNCVSFADFMRDFMRDAKGVFLGRVRVCDAAGFGTVFSTPYHGLRRG
jgi:hypothetical protein